MRDFLINWFIMSIICAMGIYTGRAIESYHRDNEGCSAQYKCGMRDVRTGVCTQYDLKEELK